MLSGIMEVVPDTQERTLALCEMYMGGQWEKGGRRLSSKE